jgi:DNA recombination protein RmuC
MLYSILAFLAGVAVCYLVLRERINAQKKQIAEIPALREETARLQAALGEVRGRLETVEAAKNEMADAFRAASSRALQESSVEFLRLAEERFKRLQGDAAGDLGGRQQAIQELVQPLRDALDKVEKQVDRVERERVGAYAVLTTQVRSLETEARKLATALASPSARGRWGEIQLRRVVELAGMLEYCDFVEQTVIGVETRLRPDLLIKLPNGKQIVVDSKVPLTAYLAACETTDEAERLRKLDEHARQIRTHLKLLGSKAYSSQLVCSPEFVVAFLPGEIFFSAALQADGELLEYGVQNNVILATPTTLIALLKAVAYGWKQEQLARNAQEIRNLGVQLYERVRIFAEHYEAVGKGLRNALSAYDKGRISMETRLLATARKLEEYGIAPASAGALPQPLPFTEDLELDLRVDDEGGSDAGGSAEAAIARRA